MISTHTTLSIEEQCKRAHKVRFVMASQSTEVKNKVLHHMAESLKTHKDDIIRHNEMDIKSGIQSGLSKALIDRLTLNESRILGMAQSLIDIAHQPDPIGEAVSSWIRPNGLHISKIRDPLGVIAIIYEARPNVTADAIGLCVKSGNAVVLRGSSSAQHSNRMITQVLREAAVNEGVPGEAIQLLEDTSREGVQKLVTLRQYLSLVIPRGGASLIQSVVTHATVPSIETGVGNCHIYVDKSANLKDAINIVINAKTQRPSVCNACETLLVHEQVASDFLQQIYPKLDEKGVEIRGDDKTRERLPACKKATNEDWDTEYLDLILAVKVVADINEAISHIQMHSTLHSESIIASDEKAISLFKNNIDAAAIVINASSRFVDGSEFGFGAEMGISTQKLHARGPMGLTELTTTKYIVEGNGQIRS
ncbi:MAG: glutamate-5-semialdehyde dehydrogenase [Candidatus Margulisbacteria bacterium]|nr:glutamate-5-semialdehyde dehydrogenase [Candidatus Margulisiibacteriota bacterium]